VSIKLHFQVRLRIQNASHHCDWNSEVSMALSTLGDCGHGADPLDYTELAFIGSHVPKYPTITDGSPYRVFFIHANAKKKEPQFPSGESPIAVFGVPSRLPVGGTAATPEIVRWASC
jgi:hypothetical protein